MSPMLKFDHLVIPVSDLARSRAWYVETLGMTVEFEVAERRSVALQDTAGFREMSARGVVFSHPPTKTFWGCVAELADPDGYLTDSGTSDP